MFKVSTGSSQAHQGSIVQTSSTTKASGSGAAAKLPDFFKASNNSKSVGNSILGASNNSPNVAASGNNSSSSKYGKVGSSTNGEYKA